MAPKQFLNIFLLLLALTGFRPLFSFAQQEAGSPTGGAPPIIRIRNTIREKNQAVVRIQIKAGSGGAVVGSTELSPGQQYRLPADIKDSVYFASAIYGMKFAAFHAYQPARDKGHAAIYWRVDDWGFSISYNNSVWKKVAPWETD